MTALLVLAVASDSTSTTVADVPGGPTEAFITVVTALFALLSPLLIAWRKSPTWPSLAKAGIPVVISAVLALAYLWLTDGFVGMNILAAFLVFYGLQQIAYSILLKGPSTWLEENSGPTPDGKPAVGETIPRRLTGWEYGPED